MVAERDRCIVWMKAQEQEQEQCGAHCCLCLRAANCALFPSMKKGSSLNYIGAVPVHYNSIVQVQPPPPSSVSCTPRFLMTCIMLKPEPPNYSVAARAPPLTHPSINPATTSSSTSSLAPSKRNLRSDQT